MKLERISPEAVEKLAASRASVLVLVIAAAQAQLEADQEVVNSMVAALENVDSRIEKALIEAKGEQRRFKPHPEFEVEKYLLGRQAEVSFKAGEQLSLEKQRQAYLEGKQAGIKEVTEMIV